MPDPDKARMTPMLQVVALFYTYLGKKIGKTAASKGGCTPAALIRIMDHGSILSYMHTCMCRPGHGYVL